MPKRSTAVPALAPVTSLKVRLVNEAICAKADFTPAICVALRAWKLLVGSPSAA
jgi:hypothetical protein